MAIKQTLQVKLSHQLALTPQLEQSIRLLQISSLDLESEVERLLLDNPLLERSDDADSSSADSTESALEESDPNAADTAAELMDWGNGGNHYSADDDKFDPALNVACPVSLRQHLLAQLGEISLSNREHSLVELLIEELDEKGYLNTPLTDIADDLPLELGVESSELAKALLLLQQFDPVGVGARSLSESLLLQLKQIAESSARSVALQIAEHHLALLARRDFVQLRKKLAVDEQSLRAAQLLIATLNPYPAHGFAEGETQYIVPEVLVKKHKNHWKVQLNQNAIPRLQVNKIYADALNGQRLNSGELPAQLQEAKWLIKSLRQRFDTILKVAEAIAEEQQEFFEQGEIAMRPLILRNIAQQLGLHESTISRVTSQKYLLCPRGLFELKYFFGSSVDTDGGGECSATAIKAQIKQMIEAETTPPLSDGLIAEALVAKGIQIARRTVAKYREAMQIPSASKRKLL